MDLTELKSRVESWMVPDPEVAQPWQTVGQIRVALLSGGYSALPFWWQGRWCFVRDVSVVRYLREGGEEHCRLVDRYRKLILQASRATEIKAELRGGRVVGADTSVDCLIKEDHMDGLPYLVVDASCRSRLLGILTPHDLLV